MKAEYIAIPLIIAGALIALMPKVKAKEEVKKKPFYYRGARDVEKYYFERIPYYAKYYK